MNQVYVLMQATPNEYIHSAFETEKGMFAYLADYVKKELEDWDNPPELHGTNEQITQMFYDFADDYWYQWACVEVDQ